MNIKLITTTLIVLKRNYLTHDLIRHGLNAYTLICREEKEDYLTLSYEKKPSFVRVHKALRIVNMSVSDDLLKKWLDHVVTNLDWNNEDRRVHERRKREKREFKEEEENKIRRERSRSDIGSGSISAIKSDVIELDIPFILPNEFIFLLCNSLNRL